jgi:hypothetical protein
MDNARLINASMQAIAKELEPQPYVELGTAKTSINRSVSPEI